MGSVPVVSAKMDMFGKDQLLASKNQMNDEIALVFESDDNSAE